MGLPHVARAAAGLNGAIEIGTCSHPIERPRFATDEHPGQVPSIENMHMNPWSASEGDDGR